MKYAVFYNPLAGLLKFLYTPKLLLKTNFSVRLTLFYILFYI